jgi:PqqD family protein of HPr-rel-A system
VVTVEQTNEYSIGDILVFAHKGEELLIHRLIEVKDGLCHCKGDNALRMEKASPDQIFGMVSAITRNRQDIPVPPCTDKLIVMAKAVNNRFFKCRYDITKTKESYIYKLYEQIFFEGKGIEMYVKNDKMGHIDAGGGELAVFDPESGDTHFLDEIGADILKVLDEPHDLDELVRKLCEMYEGDPEQITGDVREWLNTAVEKKIVVKL